MEKRFGQWFEVKEKLHSGTQHAPYVNEGDIWWFSVGENIGSEINGKSKIFTRPAIIYKKLAHGFYLVIPTTSQQKDGSWYIGIRQQGKEMWGCLHQIRTIDFRRLWSRMGRIDDEEWRALRAGFRRLYCETSEKIFPAFRS